MGCLVPARAALAGQQGALQGVRPRPGANSAADTGRGSIGGRGHGQHPSTLVNASRLDVPAGGAVVGDLPAGPVGGAPAALRAAGRQAVDGEACTQAQPQSAPSAPTSPFLSLCKWDPSFPS